VSIVGANMGLGTINAIPGSSKAATSAALLLMVSRIGHHS
jgi:hypothetical protein